MSRPIDREEVQRLLSEERAQLIELLPQVEYVDEHLPGAINVPLKQLDNESTGQLDRSRPVITPTATTRSET